VLVGAIQLRIGDSGRRDHRLAQPPMKLMLREGATKPGSLMK
jgi:hypothetical protein